MPALAAPFFGFCLGAVFAWLGRGELRRQRSSHGSHSLVVTALFSLLVYTPIAIYFLAFASDWSFGYFWDISRHGAFLPLLAALLCGASPILGLTAVAPIASRHNLTGTAAWVFAALLAAAAALLPGTRRLVADSNYAQFHGGAAARSLGAGSLGLSLLLMSIVLACAIAWAAWAIARLSDSQD